MSASLNALLKGVRSNARTIGHRPPVRLSSHARAIRLLSCMLCLCACSLHALLATNHLALHASFRRCRRCRGGRCARRERAIDRDRLVDGCPRQAAYGTRMASCDMYGYTHAHTCAHTCTHVHTHAHARTHTHAHTCTHAHTRAHTRARAYTHLGHKHRSSSRYAHMHTHAYIHTCIHTYIHTYMHQYIHTCMHTYIHACIHTRIRTYAHTYVHTYTHVYIHTYIHTYLHTYIHIFTRAETDSHMRRCTHKHESWLLCHNGTEMTIALIKV